MGERKRGKIETGVEARWRLRINGPEPFSLAFWCRLCIWDAERDDVPTAHISLQRLAEA